jgi:TolB-like protein/Tfp pilus assembly protein PilF
MAGNKFYEFGPFRLDATGRVLFRGARMVPIPPKAADTLLLLVENAGSVVAKEQLLEEVWRGTFVEEGSLTRTISVLRKLLGSGAQGRAYIITVPKRGYRFAARVEEASQREAPPGTPKVLLAVLPFEDLSVHKRHGYFSDGLTEEMITQLGRLTPERLGVIARTSAMQYRSTNKGIQRIGRELGVSYVLEGSVRREGSRVRVSAQLIQVSDQTHRWTGSYERELHDVLALQSDVAWAIAREIEIKLAPRERERLAAAGTVNPQSYEDYLKGRYLWNIRTQEALEKSIRYFERAIRSEPRHAAAYAGLADSYLTLQDSDFLSPRVATSKAKSAAATALQIDESLAEAHISLAHAHFHQLDWPAAEREFDRGIELNPSYSTAHFYYANYLLAVGRPAEAIEEAGRARALDPVSLPAQTNVAMILCLAGQPDQAIEHSLKALETDPNFAHAHEGLGRAYGQKRNHRRAIAAFQKAVAISKHDSPRYLASLAHAYAVAGRRKQALGLLRELKRLARRRYVSSYAFALLFVGLGDKEEAFVWLAKARQECSSAMPFVRVEPRLASLRADPRFQDLLLRIGLEPSNKAHRARPIPRASK